MESWKSSLRGERTWKRKARREKLHEMKAGGFAPEPQDEGPKNLAGLVRDLLNRHYHALLRHAGVTCATTNLPAIFLAAPLIPRKSWMKWPARPRTAPTGNPRT